ncbi:polymorphic toxin type 50 domain-containing protein [Novosphingobium sp.]|uniref:polymorphic toxin type 50 domain-containing protein n=1 Tax=Novosphingobium sp. TaxID=1874826 RepID=UPI003564AF9C
MHIQRVRAELSKPGKALAPIRCAAIGNCPLGGKKFYQRLKAGYGIDASLISRSFGAAVSNKPLPPRQALNLGSQNKHIRGSSQFVSTKGELTEDPKKLLDELSGKGHSASGVPRGNPGFKERVTANRIVGIYRNDRAPVGSPERNGIETDTVTIHYSKAGAHLVPAQPSGE